tara:strand:- start:9 stop:446 length:438 start_codon:yes stop_codon:yes gene_type:complete
MTEALQTENHNLDRFVRAQAGIYRTALAELQAGEKRTHWMWFIFPQMQGLGKSANARTYAIHSREEARAYLDHELLGPRLLECTQAMLAHAGTRKPVEILGPIDTMKFRSSMTLFEAVADDPKPFTQALNQMCNGDRDKATLELI